MPPLYDIEKSFEENSSRPFTAPSNLPALPTVHRKHTIHLFDYEITSPIGAAPCAVTTSRGIMQLAALGFDVLTYKTIRSRQYLSHPLPNISYLAHQPFFLSELDLSKTLKASHIPPSLPEEIAITNSIGMPSLTIEDTEQDIAKAKSSLRKGQILIVSVYGEEQKSRSLIADFLYTAQLAEEAGADIIELNLSCPNLTNRHAYLYHDLEITKAIVRHVVRGTKQPVILKIGLISEKDQLENLLEVCARAGAHGIAAINSISMKVVNEKEQPIFGKCVMSGVSGNPIRSLALAFMRQLADINQRKRLELLLFGMGGITHASHFREFHQAGAQIALSGTGMMWNPYLAIQYREHLLSSDTH